MITDERIITNLAATQLAQASTHKSIIRIYAPQFDEKLLQMYHVKTHPKGWDHRVSEIWTKGDDAVYAVRAHRLFCKIFSNNQDYEFKLGARDLWEWYSTYSLLYPSDEMTANRMHYMVSMIREGKLRIKPKCTSCHKPYVVHRDLYTHDECAVCRKIEYSVAQYQAINDLSKSESSA